MLKDVGVLVAAERFNLPAIAGSSAQQAFGHLAAGRIARAKN